MTKKGTPPKDRVALQTTASAARPTATGTSKRSTTGSGRVTIHTVAEAAGVSIATVSFVLNDRPGQTISAPVRKRVLQAARTLGYAPSAAAAALARKRTKNVSIVFYRNDHLVTSQLYSFVVRGALEEAFTREYNVLFSFVLEEFRAPRALPRIIRERNAEGALFIQDVSVPLLRELDARGMAIVAVDCHPYVAGLDTISVDNLQGGRLACRHLLDQGHRDVAFLRAAKDRPSIDERYRGFLRELEATAGCPDARRALLDAQELTFQAGYERALQALRERPETTGIFCANDELAAGVLRAARELGRSVPKDLSVIGFDDITMARYLDPPLTTVGFDKEVMGRRAMGRLIDLVEGKAEGTARELLEVTLMARGSTAPPRRRQRRSPL